MNFSEATPVAQEVSKDNSPLEKAIETDLELFTGYDGSNPLYEPSKDARTIFKDRAHLIVQSGGLEILERFKAIVGQQYKEDYEAEYGLCTEFLNNYFTPSLKKLPDQANVPIEERLLEGLDTGEYLRILYKVAGYINKDREDEIFLFMDIARLLPDNFIKARGFMKSDAENHTAYVVMLLWGFLSGTINQHDDWSKQVGNPINHGKLYEKIKERAAEIAGVIKKEYCGSVAEKRETHAQGGLHE